MRQLTALSDSCHSLWSLLFNIDFSAGNPPALDPSTHSITSVISRPTESLHFSNFLQNSVLWRESSNLLSTLEQRKNTKLVNRRTNRPTQRGSIQLGNSDTHMRTHTHTHRDRERQQTRWQNTGNQRQNIYARTVISTSGTPTSNAPIMKPRRVTRRHGSGH